MKLFLVILVLILQGCMSMGIQNMTPEQIKAAEGLLTCDNIASVYADANSVSVNMETLKKGLTSKTKITVGKDCSVTIDTESTAVSVKP